MRFLILTLGLAGLSLSVTGCGATMSRATGEKGEDLSAYDSLKSIPASVDAEVARVHAPIAGVDALLAQAEALPKTHQIDAATMSTVITTSLGGEWVIPASIQGKARADLITFVKTLVEVRVGLDAVPERAQGLAQTITLKKASIPLLATQANTKARIIMANPFSSPLQSQDALQQQTSLPTIELAAQQSIVAAEARLKALPMQAVAAMSKCVQGLQGIGLSKEAIAAVKQPAKDLQKATATLEIPLPGADASVRSAYEQLQSLPAEINAEIARLTAPLGQVEGFLAQAHALTKTHQIDPKTLNAAIMAALGGSALVIPATVTGQAKAELTAVVNTLVALRIGLYAFPQRSEILAQTLTQQLAASITLATKAKANAAIVIANQLAGEAQKNAARERQVTVDALQAEVRKQVVQAQQQLGTLPALAAQATRQFAKGLIALGLTQEVMTAVQQPIRDLKSVAAQVETAVRETGLTAQSAYRQLQGMPAEIDAEIARLAAPIAQVDGFLAHALALTGTHQIDPKILNAAIMAALGGTAMVIPATVTGQAKADLTAVVTTLVTLRVGLYTFPQRSETLAKTLAHTLATSVTLAAQAKTDAAVVLANQLATETQKSAARTRQGAIDGLQGAAQQHIGQAQEQLKTLPPRAAAATVRFAKGIAGLGVSKEVMVALEAPIGDATSALTEARRTQRRVESTVDKAGESVGVKDASKKTKKAAKKAIIDPQK